MSLYFDTRNGMIAVIETDAPDEGMIKVKRGQSTLAARYALDESGALVDRFPGKTDEEVLAEIAAQQAAPAPAQPVSRTVTKLAFMERFTDEELAAIYAAAKTDVRVEVWMDKMKLASEIDLADPRTRAGVEALEALGLIGQGRAAEVLS